jgi:hypothetical protein
VLGFGSRVGHLAILPNSNTWLCWAWVWSQCWIGRWYFWLSGVGWRQRVIVQHAVSQGQYWNVQQSFRRVRMCRGLLGLPSWEWWRSLGSLSSCWILPNWTVGLDGKCNGGRHHWTNVWSAWLWIQVCRPSTWPWQIQTKWNEFQFCLSCIPVSLHRWSEWLLVVNWGSSCM